MNQDRRQRRSPDPLIALHYQLTSARSLGELDAIVLADATGVVVAGAGSWASCEELAAYAPFLEAGELALSHDVSRRVSMLRREVEVRRVPLGSTEVLLCARGGTGRRASLDRAAVGVSRILSAA